MNREKRDCRSEGPGGLPAQAAVPVLPFPVPGGHGHLVRLFSDGAELAGAVAAFLAPALSAGNAALVFAAPDQCRAIPEALRQHGVDPDACLRCGQLLMHDAEGILGRILSPSGVPDEDSFMRVIGGLIAKASAGRPDLRAFAGMAALPWAEANPESALALERLWTMLGRTVAFSLLCAYPLHGFRGDAAALARVCQAHDSVIPCEPFRIDAPEAERLGQVAALQLKVAELEAGIAESKAAGEQAGQARSMESLRRLAGGLAHDFNNLLTAINGYSEISLSLAPKEGPLRDFLTEIRRAGTRASELTRQLLAYGRKQILAPVAFDLIETLDDLDPRLRSLLGQGVRLERVRPSGTGRILADPERVQQIILDMALNARDAMPAGGILTLELEDTVPGPGAEGGGRPYVRLTVRDTGTGMAPEVKARVFEPFFSTKKGAGGAANLGAGMGLASVYGTVHQCGGFITVDSEPGRGTVFQVYFPRIEPEGGAATGPTSSGNAAPGRSGPAVKPM